MSYFTSPIHSLLPAPLDPLQYTRHHAGMGLGRSGSAAPPMGQLGDDETGAASSVGAGFWTRFAFLSGMNFVLLWLFIREWGVAMILATVLGGIEALVTK